MSSKTTHAHQQPPARRWPGAAGFVELFEAWASAAADTTTRSQVDRTRPLRPGSVAKYRAIWDGWTAFLAGRETHWSEATNDDLLSFVKGLSARSSKRSEASAVSRRRYWSTVKRIHEHAALLDQASKLGAEGYLSPFGEPTDGGVVPPTEETPSTVLQMHHLVQLREAAPAGGDWTDVCDHAMLGLALDSAATVSEIVALTTDMVDLPPTRSRRPATVRIVGARDVQDRRIQLSADTARRLQAWLTLRGTLPCPTNALFLAHRGLGPAHSVGVWRALSSFVQRLLDAEGSGAAHVGPNVIRNAVLLAWLNEGKDLQEVRKLAGLKSVRKLDRLVKFASDEAKGRFETHLREGVTA